MSFDIPRKNCPVFTIPIQDSINFTPLDEQYLTNRKKGPGKFLCFSMFHDSFNNLSEIWFIKHNDDKIAAYLPHEISLNETLNERLQ